MIGPLPVSWMTAAWSVAVVTSRSLNVGATAVRISLAAISAVWNFGQSLRESQTNEGAPTASLV